MHVRSLRTRPLDMPMRDVILLRDRLENARIAAMTNTGDPRKPSRPSFKPSVIEQSVDYLAFWASIGNRQDWQRMWTIGGVSRDPIGSEHRSQSVNVFYIAFFLFIYIRF